MTLLTELAWMSIFRPVVAERAAMRICSRVVKERPRRAGTSFRAPSPYGRAQREAFGSAVLLFARSANPLLPGHPDLQPMVGFTRAKREPIMIHDCRMGYERPYSVKFNPVQPGAIPPHHRYLSDYSEMSADPAFDVDSEQATWPEDIIDQTKLARFCGAWSFDDAEEDDHCGGNITDEPHDAREEDGI